jgi:quinol monooxygenase YgiN
MEKVIYLLILLLFVGCSQSEITDQNARITRIANILVSPEHLSAYHCALKKQMNEAIALERGVLSYFVVADKTDPTHITIVEVYANEEAYQKHIQTPHFLTYKETVKDMVVSLTLTDVNVVAEVSKE